LLSQNTLPKQLNGEEELNFGSWFQSFGIMARKVWKSRAAHFSLTENQRERDCLY
jgi:hypothetical protein